MCGMGGEVIRVDPGLTLHGHGAAPMMVNHGDLIPVPGELSQFLDSKSKPRRHGRTRKGMASASQAAQQAQEGSRVMAWDSPPNPTW